MEKYQGLACALAKMLEEIAKLTGETWDDSIAARIHIVVRAIFGCEHHAGSTAYGVAYDSGRANDLPTWILKLLPAILELIERWTKK